MKELMQSVNGLVEEERERAAKKHGATLHSSHEALGVLWEEIGEAEEELELIKKLFEVFKTAVRDDAYTHQLQTLDDVYTHAMRGACELIQVANVALKSIDSIEDWLEEEE